MVRAVGADACRPYYKRRFENEFTRSDKLPLRGIRWRRDRLWCLRDVSTKSRYRHTRRRKLLAIHVKGAFEIIRVVRMPPDLTEDLK